MQSIFNPKYRFPLHYSFRALKGAFSPLSAHKTIKGIVIVCLLVFAGLALCSGLYIKVKAQVAQILLERAWQQTNVREENNLNSQIKQYKPWPWADTYPVAKLSVANHNIEQIVLAGATGRTLAFAPGLMMASYDFQEAGATAIAGHRDTHFSFLQNVVIGDIIEIETSAGQRLNYRISETVITDVTESHLRLEDRRSLLVLITCYPFNTLAPTGDLRYVVTAEQL